MATLQCRVVSAREELYSGEISMLIATGTEGEIGVLPGHTPLITLLKPGAMRVQTPNGEEEVIYVSGGVLEVQPKMVTVLADTAMRAHNLDESKIVEARKKAEQMLVNQSDTVQTNAALASLAESVAQLQTIRKYKTALNFLWKILEFPFDSYHRHKKQSIMGCFLCLLFNILCFLIEDKYTIYDAISSSTASFVIYEC